MLLVLENLYTCKTPFCYTLKECGVHIGLNVTAEVAMSKAWPSEELRKHNERQIMTS